MTRQASPKLITRKRLTIALIKPSKYDDEGYVIRHLRGVLPRSTLVCLCSFTEDLNRHKILGDDLLKGIGGLLRRHIHTNSIARIRGDEFAVP